MRILYLHQYFNLPSDPGITRSYELARRLVAKGHKVVMVTSDHRGRFRHRGWKVTHAAGIEIHWLYVPYSNYLSYPARIRAFMRFALRAALHAIRIPADVVFATSTPLTIAIPGVLAAKWQRIPMVFEVRDLWPELPIAMGALKGPLIPMAQVLAQWAYRNAARVVALSPDMAKGIEKRGYPSEKITVIPNASDLDLFANAHERGRKFRASFPWLGDLPLVVYTGTLGRINGVDYLVRVAAAMREMAPDVRFLVVGEGAEDEKVRRLAASLEVLNRTFYMMPPIPKRDMPAVLGAATVATSLFIDLPDMWANSANKFFDALAAGTPVAINYQGWQADLLRRTGAGIVLDVHDPAGSAAKLLAFLRDEKRLQAARHAARRLAETEFNRDRLAMKLERVLCEAVLEFAPKRATKCT
ncbi:MAG: glycosyltransferase family 4 protein [Gammaproteobacteria bacterium]|nr:glycosyltransferase family 4 protein [Gammaproteobacteria bacterium]